MATMPSRSKPMGTDEISAWFDTFAEACGAWWTARKMLHGDHARNALRPSARTSNVMPLPLSTTLAATFLKLRAMAARGIGQHYGLLWLRLHCHWPVRQIDHDLISRSIGIDPLYDRRYWWSCSGEILNE